MTVAVRPLAPGDAPACDAIVATLPYHFGQEQGRRDCATAVRTQEGLVAQVDGVVLGFLTFEHRFDDATEITWMAVHAEHRHAGVGRALMDRLAADLTARNRRLLLVLTLSPSEGPHDVDDGYASTRAFYAANGFTLARDFEGYWSGGDTPVLMIRVLD